MFAKWKARRPDPAEQAAQALYAAVVAQARHPWFYRDCGVPDSLDGRFESILLHAFLVLHRLKQAPEDDGAAGQRLFDVLFLDMDRSLREMGVGDLGVGKRIKQMVQAFYGRVAAYETGLAEGGAALEAALRRNLLGTVEAGPDQVARLRGYVERAAGALADQAAAEIAAGRPLFPDPEGDDAAVRDEDG